LIGFRATVSVNWVLAGVNISLSAVTVKVPVCAVVVGVR
jgi:hypothetical protein